MNWEQLLSLKRQGDKGKRLRIEQDDTRLGFEVDYDRIIFSSAFRSLQDKTQVIPLSKTDFVHTRLTHSLEVSVVGRSLGRLVGKKIIEKYPHLKEVHGFHMNDFGAIVAAASLAHDIGNPPFGHSFSVSLSLNFCPFPIEKYSPMAFSPEWPNGGFPINNLPYLYAKFNSKKSCLIMLSCSGSKSYAIQFGICKLNAPFPALGSIVSVISNPNPFTTSIQCFASSFDV